jgi:UDP-galactopyranose mutase
MSFEKHIQEWVSLDNRIRVLNEQIHALRTRKQEVGETLNQFAEQNNMVNSSIQITDGKIKFTNTRVAAPLTFKYIEKSLNTIIKNEGQVSQIIEYLKVHRDAKLVPEIKRFSSK